MWTRIRNILVSRIRIRINDADKSFLIFREDYDFCGKKSFKKFGTFTILGRIRIRIRIKLMRIHFTGGLWFKQNNR